MFAHGTAVLPPRPLTPEAGRRCRDQIAFLFQGGGSLAACQVGMARALVEAGIVPDLVVGTSAGALNAVAFATGPTSDLDALERLWTTMRRRDVAPISARTVMRALTGRADGLFSSAGLRSVIAANLPARLEHTQLPAHVVATDFGSGDAVVISQGATAPALLASSAFPGLYAPVTVSGRRLIDGGVSADVPLLQAEQLGATVSYVLPAAVSDSPETVTHGSLAVAYRALGQLLDSAARRDAAADRGLVFWLPAPASDASHPLDFRGTSRLIDSGYDLATTWLSSHRLTAAAS